MSQFQSAFGSFGLRANLIAAVVVIGAWMLLAPLHRTAGAEAEPDEREAHPSTADGTLPTADGFRGIWYANQPIDNKYRYKYSGGLATYPQQHHPIAIYSEQANKTFFVYGGRYKDRNRLLHMVSYYDHETGKVARPRILLDKRTQDAHDNPTLSIDGDGYLWIFSNAHGTSRPSYIHRSLEPYSIEAFELIRETNFSYGQPWYLEGRGFVFLHTNYGGGRVLHVSRSTDGEQWTEPRPLAKAGEGHYQVSEAHNGVLGTAFNYHPTDTPGSGLNHRTNLYFMQSRDGGKTWRTVEGQELDLPLTESENPALAVEYESKGRLVYMKCLRYTPDGRPVILYLTSDGWRSGPENDPRTFTLAEWTGSEWDVREITDADNNYDFATLYIESAAVWRLIGSTEPGPQEYNTGGEVAVWLSEDAGRTWEMIRQATRDLELNHAYPRRPLHAHPDFYALWADGHARHPSRSRLYFTNKKGQAYRLPTRMDGEMAEPRPVR